MFQFQLFFFFFGRNKKRKMNLAGINVCKINAFALNVSSFLLIYCCMRKLHMFIIITRSSFTYILGATLIQYARTLTNKTPTTTHQYSWQNSSWCYCTMGILTYGTTTELKLQKHDCNYWYSRKTLWFSYPL